MPIAFRCHAVIGPVTYDAVSLLRDCYINWPDEQIERWLLLYYQQLKQASLVSCDFPQFKCDRYPLESYEILVTLDSAG
jgi:aminoglycoside/choline kinase family phosphotransferase